eukprot:scaffold90121_cov69-Phaeocystis_antarctica.AAC.3
MALNVCSELHSALSKACPWTNMRSAYSRSLACAVVDSAALAYPSSRPQSVAISRWLSVPTLSTSSRAFRIVSGSTPAAVDGSTARHIHCTSQPIWYVEPPLKPGEPTRSKAFATCRANRELKPLYGKACTGQPARVYLSRLTLAGFDELNLRRDLRLRALHLPLGLAQARNWRTPRTGMGRVCSRRVVRDCCVEGLRSWRHAQASGRAGQHREDGQPQSPH